MPNRGKALTKYVKVIVAELCLEHPYWNGKAVHKALHARLAEEAYPRESDKWPQYSAIAKLLARLWDRRFVVDWRSDQPWSLLSLSVFPLPSHVIPSVLSVSVAARMEDASVSIREARWLAQLDFVPGTEERLKWARVLASKERAMDLAEVSACEPDEWLVDSLDWDIARTLC